uniref:Uncharacterized protein n=1 Tax=Mesocestoides corti TaxID=53468 RepID=A0A5K3FSJ9_MESCO
MQSSWLSLSKSSSLSCQCLFRCSSPNPGQCLWIQCVGHRMNAMTNSAGIQGSLPVLSIEEKGLGFDLRYSNASAATNVEYPSPNRKKTVTTEQALLTNQKPEPHVRRLPPESTMLATPLIIYCTSVVCFSGCLPSFPHAIGSQRDTGLAEARWSNMSAP